MSRVVAIAGSKGGVGSTTTAVNLAAALTYFTRDVSLVDANLSNPHVGVHLGAPHVPINLNHVMRGDHHILNASYSHRSGARIIPASIKLEDSRNSSLKDLRSHLNGLKSDLILLDVAAGVSEHAEHGIAAADEVLLVVNPEITSITDGLRTLKLSRKLAKPIRGVVLSRTGSPADLSRQNVEQILGYRVISEIPEDNHVRMSLHRKQAVVDSYPNSPSAMAYRKLAADLTGQKLPEDNLSWVERLMQSLGFR